MHEKVMQVANAHRLDNPERLEWMPPAEVLTHLRLSTGMTVADVGTGTGFFAIPIAKALGNAGTVFAVDLQQEMLNLLKQKLSAGENPSNLKLVLGSADATTLPDSSCDRVFMANVWHEFPDHAAVLREARRILKKVGMLVILDWRPDTEQPPGPPLEHRIAREMVNQTLLASGWNVNSSCEAGKYSYIVTAAQ